ncbi:MAG: sulfatase-like hydrolase/transferase [Desulfobacterales bacterium]|nr:sulfatase-like hydrolase/transferase [Desulfobacterales bacterium]
MFKSITKMRSIYTPQILKILIWAGLWGIGLGVLKLGLFTAYQVDMGADYFFGMTAALAGNLLIGAVLGLLLFHPDRLSMRIIGRVVGGLLFLFAVFAYHYEIAFRRLPDAGIIHYLKNLAHLMPSLRSVAPPIVFIGEAGLGILLIYASVKLSRPTITFKVKSPRASLAIMGGVALCGLITVSVHAYPHWFSQPTFLRAGRNPVIWFVQSSVHKNTYGQTQDKLTPAMIAKFRRELGHRVSDGGPPKADPISFRRKPANDPLGRNTNIILLILESVGNAEIFSKVGHRDVMPNLQRIARESLFFPKAYASGTKSSQAMPAIFAGILPQTHRNILWCNPMPSMQGLPGQLKAIGYQTAYFHGSDLSFEQQRLFLQMMGFEEIFDYDEKLEQTASGWGYDDAAMLALLKRWIIQRPAGDHPYFVSLFTLSTHDPFALPDAWRPAFHEDNIHPNPDGTWLDVLTVNERAMRFKESLHFLDYHLGDFYDWYLEYEKPKGTLLVLVGDHVASLYNELPGPDIDRMRFEVPIMIAGLPESLQAEFQPFTQRRATQYDITATLADYLGIAPLDSDQGLNLLMPSSRWPDNRLVYAVGGHNLERVYLWTDEGEFEFNRMKRSLGVVGQDKGLRRGGSDANTLNKVLVERISPFINTLIPLNKYLIDNNAYFPDTHKAIGVAAIKRPPVMRPLFVSHRGNTQGMRSPALQNKPQAIEAAIAAGFDWVEIDIQMTSDCVPVLLHDPVLPDGNGGRVRIANLKHAAIKQIPEYHDVLTLDEALSRYGQKIKFLIEIKPIARIDRSYVLNRRVVEAIKHHRLEERVIVDSFHDPTANFIKNRCRCDVGLDTPYRKKLSNRLLDTIAHKGLDWIYVHYSVVDQALIQNAHDRGLRVMAYTVNDPGVLKQWEGNFPDGIITDHYELMHKFFDEFQPELPEKRKS